MIYTKITYKEIVETYYQTHYNSAFSLLEGENAPKLGKQIKKQLEIGRASCRERVSSPV